MVQAIVLAGGLGKRMNSSIPKVLHEVNGVPMITRVINTLKSVKEISQIIVVVSPTLQVPGVLNVIQKEPLGTGDAVKAALPYITEDVVILCGDVPMITAESIKKLIDTPGEVVCGSTHVSDPTGYGRVVGTGIIEECDADAEQKLIKRVNGGIYKVQRDALFERIPLIPMKKEYYLTDIGPFIFVDLPEPELRGVNTAIQLQNLKKLSIVMAYFNRQEQLNYTLKTINDSAHKNKELIIVDDASDQEIVLDKTKYDFEIKIIRIEKHEKTWLNPCIPYNIGFKAATGDIIVIQNPEVCHIGDCLSYISKNLQIGDWLTFNTYALGSFEENEIIKKMSYEEVINYVKSKDTNITQLFSPEGHMNHHDFVFYALHYLGGIYREDLFGKMGGGFCEEYQNGTCAEDNDFQRLLIYNNFKFKIPFEKPMCIHQFHAPCPANNMETRQINVDIFYRRCELMGQDCTIFDGKPTPIILMP